MSNFSKISLFFLIVLTAFSCRTGDSKKVKIAIRIDQAKNERIDLTTANMLNLDTLLLSSSKMDSMGSVSLEITLDKPIFANIKTAGIFIPLYISPGDALTVERDSTQKSGFRFSGDNAAVQSFINFAQQASRKYDMLNDTFYVQLGPEQFLVRRDSLQKEYSALLHNLATDPAVTKNALDMMIKKNGMSLYFFNQNYVSAQYNSDLHDPTILPSIKIAVENFPDDSVAFAANMFEYGLILSTKIQRYIAHSVSQQIKGLDPDSASAIFPELVEKEIEKGNYSKTQKEYFRASNLNFWVRLNGLSPQLEKLHTHFLKDVKTPLYVKTVNKSFDQWAAIGPGKSAPDFTGTSANGKNISLSSLKGKVVYVDIWATWCGPCRGEFPDSKKLVKEFEGNDKVAFLFVSIDENLDAWKKLLPDESIPKGIHIRQKQDKQPDAIWDNYLLIGIPRYLLIDQNGKMMYASAPRPSSGKVGDLLRKAIIL